LEELDMVSLRQVQDAEGSSQLQRFLVGTFMRRK